MKRLEISKLMDEYTDTEFFPADAGSVDPEAVKARVLAKIKAPAGGKWQPVRGKLLLAAGLAAALVLLVGAGFPSIVYRLANGTMRYEQTPNSRSVSFEYGDAASPLELEGDRLFFVRGEERTDITDLISADSPYLYDGSDPAVGMTCYLIMGGTPEDYGWLEWVEVPSLSTDEESGASPVPDGDGRMTSYHFGRVFYDEQGERYVSGGAGQGALDRARLEDSPWLIAGARELGLPFVDSRSGTDEAFYLP